MKDIGTVETLSKEQIESLHIYERHSHETSMLVVQLMDTASDFIKRLSNCECPEFKKMLLWCHSSKTMAK